MKQNNLSKMLLWQEEKKLSKKSTLWPFSEMISSQLHGCHSTQTLSVRLMAHDLNNKEPFDIKKEKNPKQQNQPKSKQPEDSKGEYHHSA